jgi:hypothetical protein
MAGMKTIASRPQPIAADLATDLITRAVGIVGLCGIALIHLLDLPGKFSEVPYMGVMYLGAIGSGVALAAALVRTTDTRVWVAAGALAAAIGACFVLSRTTGLPQSTDDIGNWSEPLGISSLFVEGGVLCLSAAVVASRR